MREILFRGKRIGIEEWVEGFYLSSPEFDNQEIAVITVDKPRTPYYVSQKTIGQYTGLTDKNGEKIFEGDIIRVDDTENAVVEYDETSAFYMAVFDRAESDFGSLIEQYPNVEIIGNIHDNPELLKGETNA